MSAKSCGQWRPRAPRAKRRTPWSRRVNAAHLYQLAGQSCLVLPIVLLIHMDGHDAVLGQLNKLATRRDVRSAEVNLTAHQPDKQVS
jgi:hypothetical protein